MIRLSVFIFLSLLGNIATSQTSLQKEKQVEAINEYVHYMNEGIHGMLIVHRLLENYNQEINKYVDLDSYKINNFSNKDLPANIFVDEENWFYDSSPYDWKLLIEANTTLAPAEKTSLGQQISRLDGILQKINRLRFDVERLINTLDLTDRNELVKVYEKLEEGVSLYDQYYEVQIAAQQLIAEYFVKVRPTAEELQFTALYKKMAALYLAQKDILTSLRNKEDENFATKIATLESTLEDFKSTNLAAQGSTRLQSSKVKRHWKNTIEQASLALASARQFYNTADVPKEFKQYGKFYFYYNSDIINNFNRYGNGTVFELNNVLTYLDMPVILFAELPHYFKVIYPKKLEKVDYIAATDNKITALPAQLKDREIALSKHKIKVDSLTFTVELYDHMIEDGDIISLNFNGDWILEEMPLKAKPVELKLRINEEGKNYFLLHAENVGRRPPNTMAVRYTYHGREQQIILKSDLNVSEMIEIIYKP